MAEAESSGGGPGALPLSDQLTQIKFNADGLVPAIAQESDTGEVLMLAWMTAESLAETLRTGRMVYWSRSRNERWAKGDTSGDIQDVVAAAYDCDADTLLFQVVQRGNGACHTGQKSCFHNGLTVRPAPDHPTDAG